VAWAADARGVNFGGTLLQMRPRDLAKLGELYRVGGVWEGRRIVSKAWIRDSTRSRVMATESLRYGYQWWIPPSGGYDARGYGGQLLWVLPKQRLVIVMTGGTQDSWLPGTLAGLFILPAVKGERPLPENPAARERLAAAVRAAGEPQPRPVPPLPATVREIAGRIYEVDENGAGWKSFSLDFRDAEATIEIRRQDGAVTLPVGLDNVFRVTELAGVGTVAERGAWVDDHTFQLAERFVGDSTRSEIRFVFAEAAGDRVEVTVRRLDSGYVETFQGTATSAVAPSEDRAARPAAPADSRRRRPRR
jgi:hypothetical protein